MPVAPTGLCQVHLADGSSSGANELALSTAIMQFAMANRKDNYADLSVMGFSKASHGCTVATLSCSDAGANMGNVPTYDWPVSDLSISRLPFAANEQANMEEEARCLEVARQTIQDRRAAGKDVAAIIVEPISSLDMRSATPSFYKSIRLLAKQEGIPFIVDETKSGMG